MSSLTYSITAYSITKRAAVATRKVICGWRHNVCRYAVFARIALGARFDASFVVALQWYRSAVHLLQPDTYCTGWQTCSSHNQSPQTIMKIVVGTAVRKRESFLATA